MIDEESAINYHCERGQGIQSVSERAKKSLPVLAITGEDDRREVKTYEEYLKLRALFLGLTRVLSTTWPLSDRLV